MRFTVTPTARWRVRPGRIFRLRAGLALALLVAPGCAFFMQKPTVRIAEVRIGSVGLRGASAHVSFAVVNPNGFDLRAQEIRYRLSFEDAEASEGWRTLTEGATEGERLVSARDTSNVELELPFRYEDVGRALSRLLSSGELRYRLEGDVRFDLPGPNMRVPFDRQGTLVP